MKELRFRQVHLDFHTSELIKGVGDKFKPGEFAGILKESHINSITCFAKCHHGMSYYNTKAGVKHPYLRRDLLKEIINGCRANDIFVPVYISVGWDEYMAKKHPEWRQVGMDGKMLGAGPLQPGWRNMCFNTPYADYVASQTEEVLKNYKPEGIFFDIVIHPANGCFCQWCVKDRNQLGLDSESEEDLRKHRDIVCRRFMSRMYNLIRKTKPGTRVFFNGSINMGMRVSLKNMTHLEIESLPSGMWGYSHFPFYVRYCRTLGKDVLGMTGRFHKSWADFGSLKNKAALEYECFSMLANGAKCSIGDQMHPGGRLNKAAYERIRDIYKSVAEKEPWCSGAKPLVQIGIISVTAQQGSSEQGIHPSDEGAMRMLLETHHQFDVLDSAADFSKYKLLILPDSIAVTPELKMKLDAFIKKGGRLLLSYESGLGAGKTEFGLPQIGIKYTGKGDYCPDYFHVNKSISWNIPDMPHIMYEGSSEVNALHGTKVLAANIQPYFNRTYKHFSSHFQTPPEKETGFPAVTVRGKIGYISSPIFKAYKLHGYAVYRQLVENLLDLLLPEKLVRADLPSSCQVTVTEQKNRWVVHLLHYIPERRADGLDIIEDVIPLHNLKVCVRTGWFPSKVYLAPEAIPLKFQQNGEYFCCFIPKIEGHGMLVLGK